MNVLVRGGVHYFVYYSHICICLTNNFLLEYTCFWTVVLEKTLESPLDCKEIQQVHSEGDQPWDFFGRNDAKAETPLLWPPHAKSWLIGKDWCWEGLGAGGEGDDRGWDGWMASLTQWTWVWVNSRSWWWTGRPGVLQFMGSQSRTWLSDWTELNWYLLYNVLLASAIQWSKSTICIHVSTPSWGSPTLSHPSRSSQIWAPCAIQ